MDTETLQQIENILKYKFKDHSLVERAFTHSSAADTRAESNERLEFLGDAVLGMVICKMIFEQFPDYSEGDLTKIKSPIVSRRTCARIAKDMEIHNLLKVGKGLHASPALTGSLAAGLLEAVIAAIYIDGGFEAAEKFISDHFASHVNRIDSQKAKGNYKSLLQQHTQQTMGRTPNYELLDEKGPEHNKCFEVAAIINDQYFPSAWGISKKQAEQKAAFNALVELKILKDKTFHEEHE